MIRRAGRRHYGKAIKSWLGRTTFLRLSRHLSFITSAPSPASSQACRPALRISNDIFRVGCRTGSAKAALAPTVGQITRAVTGSADGAGPKIDPVTYVAGSVVNGMADKPAERPAVRAGQTPARRSRRYRRAGRSSGAPSSISDSVPDCPRSQDRARSPAGNGRG